MFRESEADEEPCFCANPERPLLRLAKDTVLKQLSFGVYSTGDR